MGLSSTDPARAGDVTVPSRRTPESSPSAASLSEELITSRSPRELMSIVSPFQGANDYRLAVEAWPSDSEVPENAFKMKLQF